MSRHSGFRIPVFGPPLQPAIQPDPRPMPPPPNPPSAESSVPAPALSVSAGLLAAWIAAGSLGLDAPLLRHAAVWAALATSVLAWWPGRRAEAESHTTKRTVWPWGWSVVAGAVLLGIATGLGNPLWTVLGVGLVLLILEQTQTPNLGREMRLAAIAVLGFGLYRIADTTIPAVWWLSDRLASVASDLAGGILGCPLSLGPSFLGLDFLVLSGLFYAGWLWASPRPRWGRALVAAAALAVGHLVYLDVLGHVPAILAWVPPTPPVPPSNLEQTPVWFWGDSLRALLPWGLPILAGVIHATVAAAMVRWAPLRRGIDCCARRMERRVPLRLRSDALLRWLPIALAVIASLLLTWEPIRTDLGGKRFVAYEESFLDWNRPQHDAYGQDTAGTLGMLSDLIESLGGQFSRSKQLSAEELAKADVLLVLHPNVPWPAERRQRVWDYVAAGGSLLVAAENFILEEGRTSRFNELLAGTSIAVQNDSALSPTSGWRGALAGSCAACDADLIARPEFLGLLAGSSLRVGCSARPLLVGRWGWSDPGSDAALTGAGRWEPGERLGDLVLAAQQRYGAGRCLVLGNTSSLSNVMLPGSFSYVGRLLGSLAHGSGGPGDAWRQVLGLIALVLLAVLLGMRPEPIRVGTAVLVLGSAMALILNVNASRAAVLPEGRPGQAHPVAYIDASHHEAYTGLDWGDRGITGLALTLMRNGYLPLLLPECSTARLQRAALLISIGPARPFGASEREAVRQFLEQGGSMLVTAGAEDAEGSAGLLAEYGLSVPRSPAGRDPAEPEPEPEGCIFGSYLNLPDAKAAQVVFDAVWPLEAHESSWIARVRDSNNRPIVAMRPVGKGTLAVIGDTRFALNKFLERADGEPVRGGRHNAYFWRWFLTVLTRRPEWQPPPEAAAPAATEDSTGEEAKP